MENLIGLIVFFIVSSVISGTKNKNKMNKKKPIKFENNQNAESNPQSMQDIWNQMKAGSAKDFFETIEKKANLSKAEPLKNEKKTFESKKSKLNTQTLYKKDNEVYDISAESSEGKSLNPDYVLRNEFVLTTSPETTKHRSKRDLFRNQDDLKRAVIMKEIIDRPLSIRNLGKF